MSSKQLNHVFFSYYSFIFLDACSFRTQNPHIFTLLKMGCNRRYREHRKSYGINRIGVGLGHRDTNEAVDETELNYEIS